MLMNAARPISAIPSKSNIMNGSMKANSSKVCPDSAVLACRATCLDKQPTAFFCLIAVGSI
jgi:hypothetical protein